MRHQSKIISLLWMAASLSAPAQTTQISGVVTDPTGAVVPKAQILLEGKDRGLRRSASTNQAGAYSIPLAPPGNYTITARAAGFQAMTRDGVTLNAGQLA